MQALLVGVNYWKFGRNVLTVRVFTQRRKGVQFKGQRVASLQYKYSCRESGETGRIFFREVNLPEVNQGDDILEVGIPGDVILLKFPH